MFIITFFFSVSLLCHRCDGTNMAVASPCIHLLPSSLLPPQNTGKSHSKTNHSFPFSTGTFKHQIQKVSTHYNIKKLTILLTVKLPQTEERPSAGVVCERGGPASKWGPMSKQARGQVGGHTRGKHQQQQCQQTGVGAAGGRGGGSSSGGQQAGGGGGSGSGGGHPLDSFPPQPWPLPPNYLDVLLTYNYNYCYS